eukprot:3335459-Rhodomonas_salina.1
MSNLRPLINKGSSRGSHSPIPQSQYWRVYAGTPSAILQRQYWRVYAGTPSTILRRQYWRVYADKPGGIRSRLTLLCLLASVTKLRISVSVFITLIPRPRDLPAGFTIQTLALPFRHDWYHIPQ